MDIIQRIVEAKPSLRWHLSSLIAKTLYRSSFGAVGKGSVVVSPLKLKGIDRVYLGEEICISEGAWLQTESDGTITIGDKTYVGHRSHIHAVADVVIGKRCVFADNVMINTGVHSPENLAEIVTNGPITIGDDVFLGQNVTVLSGVTIGNGAIVGAGAVVTKDILAGDTVVGVPARSIRKK